MEGVQNNDIGIVDRILQYDAVSLKNFNVNGPSQDSLLHVAVRNRNYEICKMLIKFGADVNLLNLYGQSPLHVAEANFDFRMCKCLMRKSIAYLCKTKQFWHVEGTFIPK